jgi:catechol 2,3-dioxygenase-like lactoylglutathione lyase family enzyme
MDNQGAGSPEPTANLGSTTVAQVAIVVRDIEESAKRYAEVFGLPAPNIVLTSPGLEVNATYNGKPTDARAKLAFLNLGQVQIELIEPLGGESVWQAALDAKGEHVQHIAFWVEGMQKSVDFLKSKGIPMVQRGDMGDGQYAYFDADDKLGVTLELLERVRDGRAVG